jgi:hypothetical protein
MAEGVAAAGGQRVDSGVHDDPDHAPAPDPVRAPKGWTWDRAGRHWKPKVRGPVLTALRGRDRQDPGGPAAGPDPDGGAEPVPGDPGFPGFGVGDERDPDPAWAADGSETRPIVTFTVSAETRADIKALIALAYTIPGETLPLLDPYCFGPLGEEETARSVIGAVSDIVCGSPRVARWAASAAGLMPWIKLGMALKPVAVASFHHHVLKDVEVAVDRDAREMTVTKRDWTMYTAA